jgi:hypothetical protein
MEPSDAIAIAGARQLIDYAETFRFAGLRDVPFGDPCDEAVLAIDASIGKISAPPSARGTSIRRRSDSRSAASSSRTP